LALLTRTAPRLELALIINGAFVIGLLLKPAALPYDLAVGEGGFFRE
jgi:hypothetical protein